MIPFDLQRALAGEKLVDQTGKPWPNGLVDLRKAGCLSPWFLQSYAVSGRPYSFNDEGRSICGTRLYMAPKAPERVVTMGVIQGDGIVCFPKNHYPFPEASLLSVTTEALPAGGWRVVSIEQAA